jgi:hypothetical protein
VDLFPREWIEENRLKIGTVTKLYVPFKNRGVVNFLNKQTTLPV